jgi:hypothetical protein
VQVFGGQGRHDLSVGDPEHGAEQGQHHEVLESGLSPEEPHTVKELREGITRGSGALLLGTDQGEAHDDRDEARPVEPEGNGERGGVNDPTRQGRAQHATGLEDHVVDDHDTSNLLHSGEISHKGLLRRHIQSVHDAKGSRDHIHVPELDGSSLD